MNDSIIVNKYLTREFNNQSQSVYIYVCGRNLSKSSAITSIMNNVSQIFYPVITESKIRKIVEKYLEDKKNSYLKGEFKPKSLY